VGRVAVERDVGDHLGDRKGQIGEDGALYAVLTGEGLPTRDAPPLRAPRLTW
jgi:hypothetical protein